jgi:hypothetical protein
VNPARERRRGSDVRIAQIAAGVCPVSMHRVMYKEISICMQVTAGSGRIPSTDDNLTSNGAVIKLPVFVSRQPRHCRR